jgi:hypothetical protein
MKKRAKKKTAKKPRRAKAAKSARAAKPAKPARKFRRRRGSRFGTDKRRRHRHWLVTIFYRDGEKFARVYIDRDKATRFADRQKRSPVVRATRIRQVN